MDRNQEIAIRVLAAVGGKENVSSVQHCMTRLRFRLKDETVPKDEDIKKIEGVLGIARSGGQYMVIIGQNVPNVYKAVLSEGGFAAAETVQENLDEKKEKMTPGKLGMNIMNYLSGSFVPLIPVFISAALFRTIAIVFGPVMLNVITETSDLYIMCDFMYDAGFYFMPVFLGYTAAKKIGASPVLGMLLGTCLLSPDFVAMIGVRENIEIFGLLPAPVAGYGQTVLPVVISVFFLYYVEKFFKKYVPEMLSTVFAPFLTMVVMVPILFCFAAPLGSWVGTLLGNILFWLADHGGFLAVGLIAAVYQFLVLVGMHHVIGTLSIAVMLERGVEFCCRPASCIANFACYGIALGAFLRMRNKKEKGLALGYFVTGLFGGVSEPTMFGIGIRYKRPFIGMAAGGLLGGLYAGITHVGSYTFSSPGFLGVVAFINGGTANFVNGTIACVLATITSAAVTFVLGGFEEGSTPLLNRKKQK